MNSGQRIKKLRTIKGMSTYDLAGLTGISQSTISKLENNKRKPDTDLIEKIAGAFGISLTEFFSTDTNEKMATFPEVSTIAAHHDDDEWSQEELEEIEQFKAFVRMRKKAKESTQNE